MMIVDVSLYLFSVLKVMTNICEFFGDCPYHSQNWLHLKLLHGRMFHYLRNNAWWPRDSVFKEWARNSTTIKIIQISTIYIKQTRLISGFMGNISRESTVSAKTNWVAFQKNINFRIPRSTLFSYRIFFIISKTAINNLLPSSNIACID